MNLLRRGGKYKEIKRLLPKERVYPIDETIAQKIGIK